MNKRNIIIVLGIFLAIAILTLAQAISRPTANVRISLAPSSAKIVLDSKATINAGDQYISPGRHTILAKQPGFGDIQQQFIVTAGKATKVTLLLNPTGQEGIDFLSKHPDQESQREALGGQNYTTSSQIQSKLYPIIGLLPQKGTGYSINYGQSVRDPSSPSKIALYITLDNDSVKGRALNWISFNGYNPSDYEIVYHYTYQLD